MLRKYTLLGAITLLSLSASAQDFSDLKVTDGFDFLMTRAQEANPNYKADVAKLNAHIRQQGQVFMQANAANKSTAANNTIPVVFHIVLTDAQLQQIGGAAGVEERVKTQMEVLNADYNAMNADSATIPGAFKSLYGKLGVNFALAHKDPKGNYTPGYEIVTTVQNAFDVQAGSTGSKFACSDAKFKSSGGADAWDTRKYMNVWVINITPFGVGGVGTPPPYPAYGGTTQFPWEEQGIAIAYFAFGKQTDAAQYFPAKAAKAGRTLVHETGHFLNLFHPFGMSTFDNSSCTDDDGVADTPPESKPTQSTCPNFPLLDVCSPNAPGVMFMNHMDYSADTCRTMFTKEQAARMNVELVNGGYRYSLLQNPDVLYMWPTSVVELANDLSFVVFPNPAVNECVVRFDSKLHGREILISNSLGQVTKRIAIAGGNGNVAIDVSGMAKGVYSITCLFEEGRTTQRLIIN